MPSYLITGASRGIGLGFAAELVTALSYKPVVDLGD
jgi:NAD(P)-dependent dehydrogenase (short-subunit alcohol dehydrogenase family)